MTRNILLCGLLMMVTGCVSTMRDQPASDDLSGNWEMTLPAGHMCRSPIDRVDDTHYRIPEIRVLSGLYKRRGNQLVVVEPNDKRLTEFVWEIQNPDTLVLVQSPPVRKIGSDYTGATLKRLK